MCTKFFLTISSCHLLLPGSALLLSAIRTMLNSLAFCVADKLTIVLNPCPGAWLRKSLFTQRGQHRPCLKLCRRDPQHLAGLRNGFPGGPPRSGQGAWLQEPVPHLPIASHSVLPPRILVFCSPLRRDKLTEFADPPSPNLQCWNATSIAYICPCIIFCFTFFGWKKSSNQSSREMAV